MWSQTAGSYVLVSKGVFNEAAYIHDTLSDLKVVLEKRWASLSSPTSQLAFPTLSWVITRHRTSLFLGRCLRSKSNYLLGALHQEAGHYRTETSTHTGCVFTSPLSEAVIPEGEGISPRRYGSAGLPGEEHQTRPSTTHKLRQHLVLLHTYPESDNSSQKN